MLASILNIVPILCVSNMARSLDFYSLLGFTAKVYQGDGGGGGYAFLSLGSWQLHLSQSDMLVPETNPGSGIYVYLAPDTAADLQSRFLAAGAPIRSPLALRPWGMKEFVVVDPDENLLRFGEHVG